jgi:hypothetical protein
MPGPDRPVEGLRKSEHQEEVLQDRLLSLSASLSSSKAVVPSDLGNKVVAVFRRGIDPTIGFEE